MLMLLLLLLVVVLLLLFCVLPLSFRQNVHDFFAVDQVSSIPHIRNRRHHHHFTTPNLLLVVHLNL